MKNYMTYVKSGPGAQNHDKWLVAFYEKKEVLVGFISNEYLINNDEIGDLEVKIGYEKSNQIIFDVLQSILPNKNLVLHVLANGYSWLNVKMGSFSDVFKKVYLGILLFLRFVFRIKNQKYIDSVRISLHKKVYEELEKHLKKDGLDLLDKNGNGYVTIDLKDKIGLIPKYLEKLGFYSFEYDRDWIFIPKEEFKNCEDFKNSADFPLLSKFMFGPIKEIADDEWGKLNLYLDKFLMVGFVHHKAFHFVTKKFPKNQLLEKLSVVAKKFDLEVASDHILS